MITKTPSIACNSLLYRYASVMGHVPLVQVSGILVAFALVAKSASQTILTALLVALDPESVTMAQPNVTNYYSYCTITGNWIGLTAPSSTKSAYSIASLVAAVPLPTSEILLLSSLGA